MWGLFDDANLTKLNGETVKQVLPNVLMGDLTPAEKDAKLDFVTFLKEPPSLAALRLEIMAVDLRTKSNLFEFDRLLTFARFALTTALFVAKLSVIHQATNRRDRSRLHLNEVKPSLASHFHRISRTYDADVIAFFVNKPNFGDPNPFVDTRRS
jgi:hypothetical protein